MAFRFEKLEIWHKARAFATTVYQATAKFPRSEDYGLTSQMNRAVNSITLNISEGSGVRSPKAFDSYLDHSVGSCFEVVGTSFLALDRGYIVQSEQQALYDEGEQLAKSINSFRKTLPL